MINNKNLSSKYLSGSWLSQNTIYLIKNKTRKVRKQKLLLFSIQINSNISEANCQHDFKLDKLNIENYRIILGLKDKISSNNNINISIEKLDIYTFKLNYDIKENNLIYEEYIDIINNNLMFSYSILKDKKYGKYLGIMTSSYIKVKN